MLDRVERGCATGAHADLGVDRLDVMVRGLGRDIQLPSHFLRGKPSGDQAQHLDSRGVMPASACGKARRDCCPANDKTASAASG